MSQYGGFKAKGKAPGIAGNFRNAKAESFPKQAAAVVPQGDQVKPTRHVPMNNSQSWSHPGAMKANAGTNTGTTTRGKGKK